MARSKERLERFVKIYKDYTHAEWLNLNSNDLIDILEDAIKDLEVLEILKYSIIDKEAHMIVMKDEITEKMKGEEFMILHHTIKGTEKVNKVKEWLNDK